MSTNPNAPGFEARCQVRPGDSVSVSRVQLVGHPLLAVVSIRYASLPVAAQVAITPGDARRLAAELLNQADEIEGYVPLRSEEHTSELQSRENLVCRLLLEKKKLLIA